MLHDQHWLPLVSDLQIVLLVEIFGNTNLRPVFHLKEGGGWSLIELDVLHDVGSLGSIVSNDTATSEVSSALVLELVKFSRAFEMLELLSIHDVIIDRLNGVEHSLGGHKP